MTGWSIINPIRIAVTRSGRLTRLFAASFTLPGQLRIARINHEKRERPLDGHWFFQLGIYARQLSFGLPTWLNGEEMMDLIFRIRLHKGFVCFRRRYRSPRCSGCDFGIAAEEFVMRMGEMVYHLGCFRCCICTEPLQTGEFGKIAETPKFNYKRASRLKYNMTHVYLKSWMVCANLKNILSLLTI